MTRVGTLHRTWVQSPEYSAEYDALGEEFQLAKMLTEARTRWVFRHHARIRG